MRGAIATKQPRGIRSGLPGSPRSEAEALLRGSPDSSLAMTSLLFIIFCFLFIAFFDHFFWILQQGQLMFWLVLGMLASCLKMKKPLG